MHLKTTIQLLTLILVTSTSLMVCGCMTQEARTGRVERRQDRMDSRTSGRQERWQTRAEHEDARSKAMFDAM
jgi:hypothetical protein